MSSPDGQAKRTLFPLSPNDPLKRLRGRFIPKNSAFWRRVEKVRLRACLKSHVLAASRLVINWIMAIRIHVSVVSGKASKSLLNRRERLSQPKVRSTIQRHCRTRKSLALPRPFHDRKGTLQNSGYPFNQLAGITSVCPDELQPRKAGDQPREYMFGSITVLDPGRTPVIAPDPPFSVVFAV